MTLRRGLVLAMLWLQPYFDIIIDEIELKDIYHSIAINVSQKVH
jgi:hypothetical protein